MFRTSTIYSSYPRHWRPCLAATTKSQSPEHCKNVHDSPMRCNYCSLVARNSRSLAAEPTSRRVRSKLAAASALSRLRVRRAPGRRDRRAPRPTGTWPLSPRRPRLRDDIKAHGLLRPIVEYEGMILDGCHRWRACAELGIEPATEHFAGDDPAHYVYSVNVAHRHLTKGQIAIAAAKLKDHYAEEARARMAAGGGDRKSGPVNLPDPIQNQGDAREAAGKAFGVSGKSVDQAETILKRGAPELVDKVERGEVSINQGRQIAQHPKDRQRARTP